MAPAREAFERAAAHGAEVVEPSFRAFVARQFGARGRAWLDALPDLVEQLGREWDLEVGPELPGGLLSYVAGTRNLDGRDAVLKIGAPWSRSLDELAALRAWAGSGAPAVLRVDEAHAAVLLERIRPGHSAADAGAADVARLLAALHIPAPAGLPPLGEVVRRRLANAAAERRASAEQVARAMRKVDELEAARVQDVLVHGDFDERNLLACDRRGLAAIDPLPCVGDPAYDAAYWAHANRRPGVRERRLAIAEAAGLDERRVRLWGEIVAVHG